MRIPILMNANPSRIRVRGGPLVPLAKGKWRVVFSGVKNSTFHLKYNSPLQPAGLMNTFSVHDGYVFDLEANSMLNALAVEVGSENEVSIYLEEVKK